MASNKQIAERLRAQCESLRRKPTPLADLIPLLQEAADALEHKSAQNEGGVQPYVDGCCHKTVLVGRNGPEYCADCPLRNY